MHESPEPPSMPRPSLAELADNVTQSWSDGDINWAAVHWEIGTIGLGRWGQPCLECYKTVKNTREYQRWLTKRNEEISNHDGWAFSIASDVLLTPPNSDTYGAPVQPKLGHDDASDGRETTSLSRRCRSRDINQGPPSSSVRPLGAESEGHRPVHCISGQEELDREFATGPSPAGSSASRRRPIVAKTRIVNLSELYPGFPIPESMILQPSTHIGAGDTRTDGGDVSKGDVVNEVVMSLLHNVCDAEVLTKQQVGKDATEGLGCLADKTMPRDNMSEGAPEDSDAMTSSSSMAGSASSDTLPDSAAGSESSGTIPPESTAESEFPEPLHPKSAAKSVLSKRVVTADSETLGTVTVISPTAGTVVSDTMPESRAGRESPGTILPDSKAAMELSILGTTADISYAVSESTTEAELSYTVSYSAAEGESSDTIPPESTTERGSPVLFCAGASDTIPPETTTERGSPVPVCTATSDTIPPETTTERGSPVPVCTATSDTIPPESTTERGSPVPVCTATSDTIPPESTAEGGSPMPVCTATSDTIPPESTTEGGSPMPVCTATSDTIPPESTTERGSPMPVCTATSDTIPPESTTERGSPMPVCTATSQDEISYAVFESTTGSESSDSITVGNVQIKCPKSVATDECELSEIESEGIADWESDVVPLSIFERELSSYTIPDSACESVPSYTKLISTTEGEVSDKGISSTERVSSEMKSISGAEVFTGAEGQTLDKTLSVAIVDEKPSHPPVFYPECIEALDAVIDEHDSDRPMLMSDNSQPHTNSPAELSDNLSREIHQVDQHEDHVVSVETVMHELESRRQAAAEMSYSISPKTSSTHSGTVAVMFGRDVDPTGSTSQEYSDDSQRDPEWPGATLSISDKTYSYDDVVSCPQRSPSPLEAPAGILRLSYSSPCVLVTSPYRAPSPDDAEPSCPEDQGLDEETGSSSSSSEALICRPSGDASELYTSDVSFVFDIDDDDVDDGEDNEFHGDVDADDVHYDVSDGLENDVDAAGVDDNAVMGDSVDGEGDSVSQDGNLCDLESGVVEVDDGANYVYVCDDVETDKYVNVDPAGGVDFHVNLEADLDANAITNVEAYVEFDVSAPVDAVDAVAYSVDAGIGSSACVNVDANIEDNVDSEEVKVCVALRVAFDADTGEDDVDVDGGPVADVDADDTDTEIEADPVDAVHGIDTVSDTNIDASVSTSGDEGVSSTCDMDGRYRYKQRQQQQHQQQQQQRQKQPVIITNIDGPSVTSSVPVATTSVTTEGSSASGNSHFLLDKSFTDSDLDISVINLDNEPQNPDILSAIPDNPPSESISTDTLQFSSLISDSDFDVPCQTRSDTSTGTSQISPGLREGCYVS